MCVCAHIQGFSDTRYGDVVLVRPMRDYSSKEIAFYNRMFGVPTVFVPARDTKVRQRGGTEIAREMGERHRETKADVNSSG